MEENRRAEEERERKEHIKLKEEVRRLQEERRDAFFLTEESEKRATGLEKEMKEWRP
ncbi:Hypothetical protein FKW44_018733 [Caligus rogercresseyi]|uniref:Uncharacterized protein n=1 Tax=Caligus rogercresseyi TaxID=217165 RepID=A0A7T8GUU7_CALRO|nr:Hypothetical protein FKW44_018733 [Caligus rogercresseyi]